MPTADDLLAELAEQAVAVVEDRGLDLTESLGIWREQPATLREFITSPEHLNLPPFYPLQMAAAEAILGADPTRIFEEPMLGDQAQRDARARQFQLAVLLWGKGSGKDYICSIICCYAIHVLLCLRNPQAYFNLAPGEPLDIVNVAYNADQAKKVFFEKLKQRMERWRWLREGFDVFEAGKRKWPETRGRPKVEINDGFVEFPRKIRVWSRHAQNEGYEGLNVLFWLMDEASAFLTKTKEENAERIYQTLRTSAVSRFGLRWIGFIISYPRHGDDFTVKKLQQAERNPELGMYADGPRATWDVNEGTARQQRVEVAPGHWVPVEFYNDYVADYEEALARFECKPPKARDALIKRPERLWQAVQKGRRPLIEWQPRVTIREVPDGDGGFLRRKFAAVELTRLGKVAKGTRLFMHGDPARSSDAFAVALGHGVPATIMLHVPAGEVLTQRTLEREGLDPSELVPWERDVTRVVIDAVIEWVPDSRQDMMVDLINVQDVQWQIAKHYGRSTLQKITWDSYDSAEAVQRFAAAKFDAENEQWSNPFQHRIYRGARAMFYNDLVTLPDTPSITSVDPRRPGAIYELERVEEIDGHKIDHPEGGSKDRADAVVRVIEHVAGQSMSGFSFGTAGPSSFDSGKAPLPHKPVTRTDRTPSPITEGDRRAEEKRAEERPEGELTSAGEVLPTEESRPGKFSFGSASGPPRR